MRPRFSWSESRDNDSAQSQQAFSSPREQGGCKYPTINPNVTMHPKRDMGRSKNRGKTSRFERRYTHTASRRYEDDIAMVRGHEVLPGAHKSS